MPADVAGAERADVVADAALRRRGLETIGVPDDPVGHESAVAATGHVEPVAVDPAEPEGVIDTGHEVLVILATPVADAGAKERVAVRVTAARVQVQHRVAAPGQQLELVEERVAVRAMRPTVDLEHERPTLRRIEATWLEEPALDPPATGTGELDALGRGDVALGQQRGVQ